MLYEKTNFILHAFINKITYFHRVGWDEHSETRQIKFNPPRFATKAPVLWCLKAGKLIIIVLK